MYVFQFDHAVSNGAGGYGAVIVTTPADQVFAIGRGFARTVLVERFPEAGLTAGADAGGRWSPVCRPSRPTCCRAPSARCRREPGRW